VAIVGRSGSGKSTLAKLILGLYVAEAGRVFIDGHDVRSLSRRGLRRRMGVVPQEVFLFSGTIRRTSPWALPTARSIAWWPWRAWPGPMTSSARWGSATTPGWASGG
jgi:ABC-type transport system involved in cytochrome bd biosynthesis fused ATPase/permease subunit